VFRTEYAGPTLREHLGLPPGSPLARLVEAEREAEREAGRAAAIGAAS
jgi:hypothetical protein